MNIVPAEGKILIQRVEAEGKSKGGIVLPDTAKEKPKRGRVVGVASRRAENGGLRFAAHGVDLVPVRVEDEVIFSHYSTMEFEIDGEKYLALEHKDILAVIPKE